MQIVKFLFRWIQLSKYTGQALFFSFEAFVQKDMLKKGKYIAASWGIGHVENIESREKSYNNLFHRNLAV